MMAAYQFVRLHGVIVLADRNRSVNAISSNSTLIRLSAPRARKRRGKDN